MDEMFFKSLDPSKKLLYIPTAMVGGYSYDECYAYISHIVQSLWMSIEIDSYPYLDTLQDISGEVYSWIYIWWGNTFKLLYEIKKHELASPLVQFLRSGWPICWWSAGAIIFGNTIDTAPDANVVGLRDTKGMNLVHNMSIRCHYQDKAEEQIKEYLQHFNVPVIALRETSWLKIDRESMQIIGEW